MKKLLLLLAAVTLVFTACNKEGKEEKEFVSKNPTNKNVVLEEFTGQGCGYCPDGQRICNEILEENPGRFFPINIHGGYLSRAEMQCDDAKAIQTYFGPSGVPAGVINRGNDMPNRAYWKSKTAQLLAEPAYVNVAAKGTIDAASRALKLRVQVYYTGTSDETTNYLSVAMLQNNIVADQSVNSQSHNPSQELPNGKYNHMHILRDIINEDTWGDVISPTTAGSLIEKEYNYTIPAKIGGFDVDLDNIEFIVFVAEKQHRYITNACKAEITKK